MFLRWLERWLDTGLFVPPDLPANRWERLFLIAEIATKIKLPPLGVEHFSKNLELCAADIGELFRVTDVLIRTLRTLDDRPAGWDFHLKDSVEVSLVDFSYSTRNGYFEPEQILQALIKKTSVIHYHYEAHGLHEFHNYFPYLEQSFGKIVDDLEEVFSTLIEMYHEA